MWYTKRCERYYPRTVHWASIDELCRAMAKRATTYTRECIRSLSFIRFKSVDDARAMLSGALLPGHIPVAIAMFHCHRISKGCNAAWSDTHSNTCHQALGDDSWVLSDEVRGTPCALSPNQPFLHLCTVLYCTRYCSAV